VVTKGTALSDTKQDFVLEPQIMHMCVSHDH